MCYIPCRERAFTLSLADDFEYHYWYYLHWLKHLISTQHRVGGIHGLCRKIRLVRQLFQHLLQLGLELLCSAFVFFLQCGRIG